MLWNIINLAYRWLSIRRWNNYPRIEEFMENEHLSLKLQLSYIVVKILQEKWKQVNLLYIYKNIFWNNFFTFIYSDIKFDVKKYLRKNYKEINFKLYEQIYNFFNELDLPDSLLKDFNDIIWNQVWDKLFENKYELEDNIISFVKVFEVKLELENNVKFYPLAYEWILPKIEEDIVKYWELIWFDEWEILKKYAWSLIKLKFAYRWNRMNRDTSVSVLSHLFLVFMFSYFLWNLKWFDDKQLEQILTISLLHDIPEALTWDVITPTKKAVPWFSQALEEIETKLVDEKIISLFSNYSFKEELKKYTLDPFEWEIGKIAKYADNLSAMFEAKIENSTDFNRIYRDIKKHLWNQNDVELDYILKYGADYFDEDVETKWKKFIHIA